MGFSINDLLNLTLLHEAEIVAGRNGINNEIIWVNMMEILDELGSLQKGELLLTTGYNLEIENIHKDLIKNLNIKKMAGIAIQPGYYIKDIPKYIIEDADKYGFPVIKIPKKITFSHLTRTILKNIDGTINKTTEIHPSSNVLFKIIEKNIINKDDVNTIREILHFDNISNFYVFAISIKHIEDGLISKNDLSNITNIFFNSITEILPNSIMEQYFGKIILLTSNNSDLNIQHINQRLNTIITSLLIDYKNFCFHIGISNSFNFINEITNAYKEATASQEILDKLGTRKGVCLYKHLNFFQYLNISSSSKNNIKYINEILNPIKTYDKTHNCNYFLTLKIYLNNNCNMNLTSEKLFIHRHTLRYRLEKIQKLFNIDLNDYTTFLKYSLVFYLDDLY